MEIAVTGNKLGRKTIHITAKQTATFLTLKLIINFSPD